MGCEIEVKLYEKDSTLHDDWDDAVFIDVKDDRIDWLVQEENVTHHHIKDDQPVQLRLCHISILFKNKEIG